MAGTITINELKQKVEQGDNFTLVEALSPQYYRHTHLPHAINLPPTQVAELASTLLPNKNADIVLYCADVTCPASEEAADQLEALGYTHVRTYKGGKAEWIEAGLPTEGEARAHRTQAAQ